MYTLVGSRALESWLPGLLTPKRLAAADYDYLTSCEVGAQPWPADERGDVFEHPGLRNWNWGNVATLDELYTLKISHGMYVPNRNNAIWHKHAHDSILMKRSGAKFIQELYEVLAPMWKSHYNTQKTNTKMTKEKFFSDAVIRKYDHDSLHESMALRGKPMYLSVLNEGSQVDCSWDKFQSLSYEDQLVLCFEEVAVTALERILIPSDYTESPRAAYAWALCRVATSLFKNNWALFLLQNLDKLYIPMLDYRDWHLRRKELLIEL